MRLYGVIQALRAGRMPDNAQLDQTLQYFVTKSPIDISKLSPEGKKLVEDVRAILETVSVPSTHFVIAPLTPASLAFNSKKRTRMKSSNSSSTTHPLNNSAIGLSSIPRPLFPTMALYRAKTTQRGIANRLFNTCARSLNSS